VAEEKISFHHLELNHRSLNFWLGATFSYHPGGMDIFAFIYNTVVINSFGFDLIEGSDMSHIDRQDLKSSLKFEDLWFDFGIYILFTDL